MCHSRGEREQANPTTKNHNDAKYPKLGSSRNR